MSTNVFLVLISILVAVIVFYGYFRSIIDKEPNKDWRNLKKGLKEKPKHLVNSQNKSVVNSFDIRKSLLKISSNFDKIKNLREAEEIKKKINIIIQSLDSPLLVTVLGEFSSGKSTFINALIEEKLLAMKVRPTTATITRLQYGSKRSLEVNFRDGKKKKYNLKDLHELTVESFVKEDEILNSIAYVQVDLDNEILREIDIADTPGFNSSLERHSEITAEFINHSDIILWLFDANQLEKKTTFELIERHCKFSKPIGIINKVDQIFEGEEEQTAKKYINELIERIKPFTEEVFTLSASQALREENRHKSGIIEIKHYFINSIIPNAIKTKKIITASKISQIAVEINQIRESIIKDSTDKKKKLENFKSKVDKYNDGLKKFNKSCQNWSKDVDESSNTEMLKNVNRYLLVDGVNNSIKSKVKDLLGKHDSLNSRTIDLDNLSRKIESKRDILEQQYAKWHSKYSEYDQKYGKKAVDAVWRFLFDKDITDEKNDLNQLANEYSDAEEKFNDGIKQYNNSLNQLNIDWERYYSQEVYFLNKIILPEIKMQERVLDKLKTEFEKEEDVIKDIESEYKIAGGIIKIIDEAIFHNLSEIFKSLKEDYSETVTSSIDNYESLVQNLKKFSDGYVNLDWKMLYSRNKINSIIDEVLSDHDISVSGVYKSANQKNVKIL